MFKKSPCQTQIEHQNYSQTNQSMTVHNTAPQLNHQSFEIPVTQFSEVTASTTLEDDKVFLFNNY